MRTIHQKLTLTRVGRLGPYTSASSNPTEAPRAAREYARFTATVLFPTPPLQLLTHTTSRTDSSPGGTADEDPPPTAPSPPPLPPTPYKAEFCWCRRGLRALVDAAAEVTHGRANMAFLHAAASSLRPGSARVGTRRVKVTAVSSALDAARLWREGVWWRVT